MQDASDSAWRLNVLANRALSLAPVDLLDPKIQFEGQPAELDWQPPQFHVFGKSYGPKDFVAFTMSAPVVSERARTFIETQLPADDLEFLDFGILKGRKYFLMNVMRVIDAIDWGKSKVFFSASEAQGRPESLVLRERIPEDVSFFRLDRVKSYLFVQDASAAKLAKSSLTGFGLTQLKTDVFKRVIRGERLNEHPSLVGGSGLRLVARR